MLIVDDCSPDSSSNYIASILPDERFKLISLTKNVGAAEARNIAIKKAKGRYIAFLDSDDIWYSEKLEKQLDFMKKKNVAFCFSSYELMDEEGRKTGKQFKAPDEITKEQYLKNTIIGCLTVIIDKSKIKPFEMPNLRSSHDMALWYEVMRDNKISAYGIREPLACYRVISSSNTANKSKAAKEVWAAYRKYFKFGIIKSTWYFLNYSANAVLKRVL